MKPLLRDYLYFSKAQRRGLVFLISIILISSLALHYYPDHFQTESQLDKAELDAYWVELQDQIKVREGAAETTAHQREEGMQLKLFPFDPNQISIESWKQLGLSRKQAQSILKYRDKGGEFRKKSDLKKMYVVSDELFQKWEPFIQIPESNESISFDDQTFKAEKKAQFLIIDINHADSADLIRLKGIGPVYASRIVKYRNALGGFHSIEQLAEVWGLNDSTLNKIIPHLALKEAELKMIRVNHLSAEEIKDHPYISWSQANAIVNYRIQHGPFYAIDEMRKIYALDSSFFEQLLPYLEFQ